MAQAKEARLPPQNLEAEEYVLGAMMLSAAAIDACAEIIRPADFYRESHGVMFAAALALRADGEPVDALTLGDRLARDGVLQEVGGAERIRELATIVPAASNAPHHAALVKEAATLRGLATAGAGIWRLAYERGSTAVDLLEQAEIAVFDLARQNDRSEFVTLAETVPVAWKRLEELHESGESIVGVPSGLHELDEMTAGFQGGNLIVVAARPSMGKSALALSIAADIVLRQGKPVALFTLEMSRVEITNRLTSMEAQIDGRKIRTGRLDAQDWQRAAVASSRLKEAPLYIDDGRLITVAEIRSKCRRLKLRRPDLAMVILDYIQLMGDDGVGAENRVQAISQMTRSLKVLAGDLDLPIVALSQLSRAPESRHDHRPVLSDLRESGAIEQDSDMVLFLYRDEYYHQEDTDQTGIAEINVAKHRNGPTGTIKVAFIKHHARFANLQRRLEEGAA